MKAKIHPSWHDDAVVKCTCGNTFTTGSTKKEIAVEICAQCHPFFTGEMKFVDIQGRVEKFEAKRKAAEKVQAVKKAKLEAKKQVEKQQKEAPKTLKEMLMDKKKALKTKKLSSKTASAKTA